MSKRPWFLLPILLLIVFSTASCSTPSSSKNTVVAHGKETIGSYIPFQPLLKETLTNGPVYVTGDQSVPIAALMAASKFLKIMLQHRPDVVVALRNMGTFTVVASRNQTICSLSYFRQYSGSLCQRFGEGGAGGTIDSPITACDEKNLLLEPDDPYQRGKSPYSQNICVHELAHTIMNVGLTQDDRERIDQRYQQELHEEHWKKSDYAMSDDQEFWAVMSQFYFWAGPDKPYSPPFTYVANSPDALKSYDPATFALLDSIYRGSAQLQ